MNEIVRLTQVKKYSLRYLVSSICLFILWITNLLFYGTVSVNASRFSISYIFLLLSILFIFIGNIYTFIKWIVVIVNLKQYENRIEMLVFAWLSLLGISIITASICFKLSKNAINEKRYYDDTIIKIKDNTIENNVDDNIKNKSSKI